MGEQQVDVWYPDLTRDVYDQSDHPPDPYPTHHAVDRWRERTSGADMTVLDAWHTCPPVGVKNDSEAVAAALYGPDRLVLLGIRDQQGKLLIKTVKYREWLEENEGKVVTDEHLSECPTCECLYNEHPDSPACPFCDRPEKETSS